MNGNHNPWVIILAQAPDASRLTDYDLSHCLTYARLIDAERVGTDWRKAASQILLCDVERDPEGTKLCWESHLARAHWVVSGEMMEGQALPS
jgi:hypothetical protein